MSRALKIAISVAVVLFLFFYASNDFQIEPTLVPYMIGAVATGGIVAYAVARVWSQKR